MVRLAALLLVCSAALAEGQRTTTLEVIVVDSAGDPVVSADARLEALSISSRVGLDGRHTFVDLPEGRYDLLVRKVGYVAQVVSIRTGALKFDSVRVVLPEIVVELQGVRISAAQHPFVQDYERRRAKGIGTFITPKQIQDLKPSFSSEIFRQMPMVRLISTPSGYGIRFQAMLSINQKSSECIPMLWIDGQRVAGMEIDEIGANDIFAVEIYRGASTIPMQFISNGHSQCGAIVVWTKREGATFKKRP
jgi:hypothetical protein